MNQARRSLESDRSANPPGRLRHGPSDSLDRADFHIKSDVAILELDNDGFGVVELTGNSDRKAERLYDFELGYRAQLTRRRSLDLAVFSSHYHGHKTNDLGASFFQWSQRPHMSSPYCFADKAHAHNYGADVFANWNVTYRLRISPGYSFLQMHVAGNPSSNDPNAGAIASDSPKHQFQIRSSLSLTS